MSLNSFTELGFHILIFHNNNIDKTLNGILLKFSPQKIIYETRELECFPDLEHSINLLNLI